MSNILDHLEKLHAEATKGEWHVCRDIHGGKEEYWCKFDQIGNLVVPHMSADDEKDAALIVAMHAALPALIKIARAAEEVVNEDVQNDPHDMVRQEFLTKLSALSKQLSTITKDPSQ